MNQRNGTAVLDDSPEGSIFPDIAWQQPQALDVVTEGMAQCLSSWAADSKEVKLQHECALGLKIESADQLVSMRYCEFRSASVVLDDCQTCPCPAFCSNSASNNTHEASESLTPITSPSLPKAGRLLSLTSCLKKGESVSMGDERKREGWALNEKHACL
jgi:hypothetical protein